MSNQLTLQTDPIQLGLQTLKMLKALTETCTTNNIEPIAAAQLVALGDLFHVSGHVFARVKSLLQRQPSITMKFLAFTIGLLKGDTASTLGNWTGGQAAALLSVCLSNMYSHAETGEIVYQLSSELLPYGSTICSPATFVDAVKVLTDKLADINFPTILNDVVEKIEKEYYGAVPRPACLMDKVAADTMVSLLKAVSEAVLDEDTIVTVTGTRGIAHIMAMMLSMFPRDTQVTVENKIIHASERRAILLEIEDTGYHPATINVQRKLNHQGTMTIPVETDDTRRSGFQESYRFSWKGWLAERLKLRYREFGLSCTPEILQACSELLISYSRRFEQCPTPGRKNSVPLLRSFAVRRMEQVCVEVFGTTVTPVTQNWRDAFGNLKRAFRAVPSLGFSCRTRLPDISAGWPSGKLDNCSKRPCALHQLWVAVGRTLNDGFACFLIEPGPNVTVQTGTSRFATDSITMALNNSPDWKWPSSGDLWDIAFGLQGHTGARTLGTSAGACALYPALLETLEVPSERHMAFRLVEGRFVYNKRYFSRLNSCSSRMRAREKRYVVENLDRLTPSDQGAHHEIFMTIGERADCLDLQTIVHVNNAIRRLNIMACIQGCLELDRTHACGHPSTAMLDQRYIRDVVATTVERPRTQSLGAQASRTAIAMTKRNPTAQLLCCEPGQSAILMEGSCLNCAFEEAKDGFDLIIVS